MYRRLLFPLLTKLEPERSHELALTLLRLGVPAAGLIQGLFATSDPRLRVHAFGLEFANPIGLAAGFDKNGVAAPAIAALGFGHVEVGTVTPRPQPGKPKPRLFRLKEDAALINRLGFPSLGANRVARHLESLVARHFVLGANVGPNADSVGVEDFVTAAGALVGYVDYLTVNVSSPNTAGLRGMQHTEVLAQLLAAVMPAAPIPVLVKIAPDLSDAELVDVLDVVVAHGVSGIVATNTTVERPDSLRGLAANEAGGLSGLPLRDRSNDVVRIIYRHTSGSLPIVAAGGVATWRDALDKIEAGATLVQLYTGFVYEGPTVARRINRGLLRFMAEHAIPASGSLVGTKA